MKTFYMTAAALAFFASQAIALTLTWDRNTDDATGYYVYYCSIRGCTPTKASSQSPRIPQSAIGVNPVFTLPANTEGAAAVSAFDAAGNESGLSVIVPFDQVPPLVPVNPRVQ